MAARTLISAAIISAASLILAVPVIAAGNDYAFEAVKVDVKNGEGSEVAVRLMHKPSGKPVRGAIIFRTRLDMSPDDMAGMTAKLDPMPGSEPGTYRFKADFTMAGRWALKLMAKVPGEADTIQGSVIFNAKD